MDYVRYIRKKVGNIPINLTGTNLIVLNEKEEILLQKRGTFPYKWGLLGGIVELGESLEECVIREAKEAARLTNVTLKNVAPTTATNSNEVFNIMMVSGKLPDIVGGDSRRDDFIKYGMEGAFIPLNDLIDKHAPHIKKFFEENPAVKNAITAPDGNIYFIPYVQDGRVARMYWIRQDWLDKLGLQQPNTPEELYQVLKAFKEKDPNGNGLQDEIPFITRDWNEMIRLTTLWGARTAGTDARMSFYKKDNGKVALGWAEPEFKEGLKHIIKWYQEGLIDPEVFTRGKKTREILFASNQGGMTHDWPASTSKFNDALKDKVPGFNIQPMLPPVNTKGIRFEENQRALVKPDGWAITYENKHPVETIKYFDFFWTEEGRRLANFGVEGQQYTMVNGKPQFTDAVLNSGKAVNQQLWEIGAQIPIGFKMDYEYERQWTNPIAQKGIDMYMSDKVTYPEEYVMPNLSVADRKVYDAKWTYIGSYIEETVQTWILQGADLDQEWDNYMATLDKLGLNEILALIQKAEDKRSK
jgi:putative aldouronate transport system substrate-binding protein